MIELVSIADIQEQNGKTVRQNNYARLHAIPIGVLVEIQIESDDDDYYLQARGVRLYVILHTRDCDGSPMYSLGMRKDEINVGRMDHGWDEESLSIVPRESS